MLATLIAAALTAAPTAVPPAKATAQPTSLGKVRGWEVLRMPDGQCRVVSAFGADTALIVWVNKDGANGLSILIDKASYAAGTKLSLAYELGDLTYSGGPTAVIADGTVRALDTGMDAGLLAQLRRSRRLAVYTDDADYEDGDGDPIVTLTFDDMAPVVDALDQCTGRHTPAAVVAVTKPQFLNKAAIITADDYPPAALRANAQGTVRYRIGVTSAGAVSDCVILASSGNADLDTQTCALLRRRARLTPAKDAAGKAVADTFEASVYWRVPG